MIVFRCRTRYNVQNIGKYISLQNVSAMERRLWAKRLICICGPSGSGKTTLCRQLVEKSPDDFTFLGSTITTRKDKDETE